MAKTPERYLAGSQAALRHKGAILLWLVNVHSSIDAVAQWNEAEDKVSRDSFVKALLAIAFAATDQTLKKLYDADFQPVIEARSSLRVYFSALKDLINQGALQAISADDERLCNVLKLSIDQTKAQKDGLASWHISVYADEGETAKSVM
jgi:hypothetical protein